MLYFCIYANLSVMPCFFAMVKMIRGTLIKTEPSLKEIIMSGRNDAVIEDVNDTAIFVKTENVTDIKIYVEKILAGATKQAEKNEHNAM